MKKRVFVQNYGKWPSDSVQADSLAVCKKLFDGKEDVEIIGYESEKDLTQQCDSLFDIILISGSSLMDYDTHVVQSKLTHTGLIISFSTDRSYLDWLYYKADFVIFCHSFTNLNENDSEFLEIKHACIEALKGNIVKSQYQQKRERDEKRQNKNIREKLIPLSVGIVIIFLLLYFYFK